MLTSGCMVTLFPPLQLFWALLGFGVIKLLRFLNFRRQGSITLRMKIQRRIDVQRLREYVELAVLST